MKIFNIVYFIIGFPYFLILNVLSGVFTSVIQASIAFNEGKFPWEVSLEHTIKVIEGDGNKDN